MCVLIRVASRCQLTFTTEYIHNVLKTFLPLVTRLCRFDQITRGKIKPRTEGFINHVQMAATLIFTQPRPQGLLAFLSPPYWISSNWNALPTEIVNIKSIFYNNLCYDVIIHFIFCRRFCNCYKISGISSVGRVTPLSGSIGGKRADVCAKNNFSRLLL